MLKNIFKISKVFFLLLLPYIIIFTVLMLEITSFIIISSSFTILFILDLFISIKESKNRSNKTAANPLLGKAQVIGGVDQQHIPLDRFLEITEVEGGE